MSLIDLRSDTVTKPSPGMLEAMMYASVGDDVYGEDETVNAFQDKIAGLFGKEKGLFVPTGVMSNQLAIKALTLPGDEVIVEHESHIFHYENASPALLSGVQLHPVVGERGTLQLESIEAAIRPDVYYFPVTRLICMENTHNREGGTVIPLQAMQDIFAFAKSRSIAVHLDGARIWNAHIASGVPLNEYGKCADTISVCFSKGLGAPIGSMLIGNRDVIMIAHKYRKTIGGGMRQVGLLAAAADYAVTNNLRLLEDDHRRAKHFANELADFKDFLVTKEYAQSNMVLLDFSHSQWTVQNAIQLLFDNGIVVGQGRGSMLRAVFHLDITDSHLDQAISIFHKLFS